MSIPGLQTLIGLCNYIFHTEDILRYTPPFGSCEWIKLGVHVDAPAIPQKIVEYLEKPCPIWPGKLVKETHFLFLLPDNLNLEKLYELDGTKSYSPFLHQAEEFSEKPRWVLITKKAIPETRGEDFAQQGNLVSRLGYTIPTPLQAAAAVVAAKKSGFVIYPRPGQFTRCKTKSSEWPLAIGSDGAVPFSITTNDCNCTNGAAGIYIVAP